MHPPIYLSMQFEVIIIDWDMITKKNSIKLFEKARNKIDCVEEKRKRMGSSN